MGRTPESARFPAYTAAHSPNRPPKTTSKSSPSASRLSEKTSPAPMPPGATSASPSVMPWTKTAATTSTVSPASIPDTPRTNVTASTTNVSAPTAPASPSKPSSMPPKTPASPSPFPHVLRFPHIPHSARMGQPVKTPHHFHRIREMRETGQVKAKRNRRFPPSPWKSVTSCLNSSARLWTSPSPKKTPTSCF